MVSGNIFLVGPMGAGKSTVGRQLAKALGRDFYDSDKEIEKRTGVSISWIFEMEGEEGFRIREQKVIEELTQLKDIVLATGGGAILSDDTRRALRSRGHVIYLSASAEQLFRRTVKDKTRPLLQTEDPKQQIIDLLAIRDPLYQSVADVELRTGDQSIQHAVSEVIKQLENVGQ
ncbi:MAG: shikimate kinase AroK [Methylococcaceae bacterium]|nr:shikimate kinase AroK [Methylococcaceae bacterium]